MEITTGVGMSQFFQIHPINPQQHLIREAAAILRRGGVIIYPTDSAYALGCQMGNKQAIDRIRSIRQLDEDHYLSLLCRDLSELSTYARVDNKVYRLLKANTPGPYTFILKATSEVPRRLLHPKRKTIGLRVPDCLITQALLEALDEPMMSSTLALPGAAAPLIEPDAMRDLLGHSVDLVIDGGPCGLELTTVVDLVGDVPVILRKGRGDPSPFLSE
jgi:tRNA threonylcarbamoyl adenosine modification protein (Sua5/YciO/YrdC/YwlC family)